MAGPQAVTPSGPVPRQPLLVNLLLSLVVFVITGVVLELGARLLDRGQPEVPAEERPLIWETGWQGDFYLMSSRSLGWPPSEAFNRDGVRDRTHTREKPGGVWRVAALGDSVTVGPDDAPAASWPARLRTRLAERGPGVEVLNVSLWGWSTRQERIAYGRIVRQYRPDQVILGLCLNDMQELQNNLSRPAPAVAWLFRRSALLRRIVDARGREIAKVEDLFQHDGAPRVRQAFERTFEELRALRREVAADGATLSILIFPYLGQVLPGAPEPTAQQRLLAFCRGEGLDCLDLRPPLQPLARAGFDDGIHLSAAGNDAVAAHLVASGAVKDPVRVSERLAARGIGPGGDAVGTLIAGLGAQDPADRAAAAWALGRIGAAAAPAREPLVRVARGGDVLPALAALDAMAAIGVDAEAETILLDLLTTSRQPIRWRAAETLARSAVVDGPARVSALSRALGSDDSYIRAFAAWSLGELRDGAVSAIPALVDALRDPEPRQRELVIQALGRIPGNAGLTVPALRAVLQRPEVEDRWRAARALGRLGHAASAAVPDLQAAAQDTDAKVRAEAEQALERMR